MADEQSAGKGRGANVWSSPRGCLAASLSTTLALPGTRLPFVQYVVSLAVLRAAREELVAAITEAAGDRGDAAEAAAALIRIKWPNDVYLDGRKLAGVLCHSW